MEPVTYLPIGVIHSPFTDIHEVPKRPLVPEKTRGYIDIDPQLVSGLADLDGFSHILILTHMHESHGFDLSFIPWKSETERGLFSTRSPRRPNPIGISILELEKIEGGRLWVNCLDMIDGTPLLDIKPHVPQFEEIDGEVRIGWLKGLLKNENND